MAECAGALSCESEQTNKATDSCPSCMQTKAAFDVCTEDQLLRSIYDAEIYKKGKYKVYKTLIRNRDGYLGAEAILCHFIIPVSYEQTADVDALHISATYCNDELSLQLTRHITNVFKSKEYAENRTRDKLPIYTLVKIIVNADELLWNIIKLYKNTDQQFAWSNVEEERLEKALAAHHHLKDPKTKWTAIAGFVGTKSAKECYIKYRENWKRFRESQQERAVGTDAASYSREKAEPAPAVPEDCECEAPVPDNAERAGDQEDVSRSIFTLRQGQNLELTSFLHTEFDVFTLYSFIAAVECMHCRKRSCEQFKLGPTVRKLQRFTVKCRMCHRAGSVNCMSYLCSAEQLVLANFQSDSFSLFELAELNYRIECSNCTNQELVKITMSGSFSKTCSSCFAKIRGFFNQVQISGQQKLVNKKLGLRLNFSAFKFVKGQPLPKNGTCSHFKRSQRWFIWSCCKIPYPCPECHDKAETHKAEGMAIRLICGFCSGILPSDAKTCSCGNNFNPGSSNHWEGGKGCRDQTRMSRKDKRKYKRHNSASQHKK